MDAYKSIELIAKEATIGDMSVGITEFGTTIHRSQLL